MHTHAWPIPNNVSIAMTNRHGGVSASPFDSLNLGTHVGDDIYSVMQNRQMLQQQLGLTCPITWLDQVHGTQVLELDSLKPTEPVIADAVYSRSAGQVCAVMTADCLPILLCNKAGTEVAAVHAGWRGLCYGVIEAAVAKFNAPNSELIAYLGPAIGPSTFEVGNEVREAFCQQDIKAEHCFIAHNDKYFANLEGLAQLRLRALGISHIHSASVCTFSDLDYFSYRRSTPTGRMASLIWINASQAD
jgi:YfiH family protein